MMTKSKTHCCHLQSKRRLRHEQQNRVVVVVVVLGRLCSALDIEVQSRDEMPALAKSLSPRPTERDRESRDNESFLGIEMRKDATPCW